MQAVPIDLTEESDAWLLYLIGEASGSPDDAALARDAMRAFHARHHAYVLGVLGKFADGLDSVRVDVELFASKTFVKAFKASAYFVDDSGGDAELARRKVCAWLGRIANNLARDEFKHVRRKQCGIHLVPFEEGMDVPVESDEDDDSEISVPTHARALARLNEIKGTLKPAEWEILITYATWGRPAAAGRQLPAEIREALEKNTGYERSNIRQIWKRLSQRLKDELAPFLTT